MSRDGHIELDWAVDAIRLGSRVRQDLGDLAALVESIRTYGLLQPITVSPDGILLCGARRLAAVQRLGLRQINVWIRTGLSNRLERLIAEQDENTLRTPLLPTEAAALYRELKQILAEDAARRQEATRFNHPSDPDFGAASGAAESAAPRGTGDTRRQAARRVTGGNSYTRLEQVNYVQQIAADPTLPDDIRELATDALTQMDAGGKVDGYHRQVQTAVAAARRQQLADLAQDAIKRATRDADDGPTAPSDPPPARRARQLGVRAFLLTWNDLAGWTDRYDPTVIGRELTAGQWDTFVRTVRETTAFLDQVAAARGTTPAAS